MIQERLDTWTWIWLLVSIIMLILFIIIMIFYQKALTERVNPKNLPGGISSIDYAVITNSVGNSFRQLQRDDLNDAFNYCTEMADCNAFSWNENTKDMLILTSNTTNSSSILTTSSSVFNTFWR